MTPERYDHMVTQYVWALENEHVFMTKARAEIERGNYYQFCLLVTDAIIPIRKMLGEAGRGDLSEVELSYLFVEMRHRLDGSGTGFATDRDQGVFSKHWDTLDDNGYRLTNELGVIPKSTHKPSPKTLAEPEKETIMSKQIEIKNVTFINNVDVTTMHDDMLISTIKQIEGEIADLSAVKTKSKKIEAKIAEAQATLAKVVEILDAR